MNEREMPAQIWLQSGGSYPRDVSWSDHQICAEDTGYVRADLAQGGCHNHLEAQPLEDGQIRWAIHRGEVVPCEVHCYAEGKHDFYLMGMTDYYCAELDGIGPVITPPDSTDGFYMVPKPYKPDPATMNSPIWIANKNRYGVRPLVPAEMFIFYPARKQKR